MDSEKVTMFLRTFLSAALLATPLCAGAQSFPSKPIRLIVAFPAGGATDLVARAMAQRFSDRWQQSVIVDNRSGAGGVIGTELASRAPADGYTVLFGSSSTFATGPVLQPKLPYHPQRDFAPISLTTLIPNIIVAHASVPVTSVKELIEFAKSKPQVSYASNGNATASHIAGELLRHRGGFSWTHVPYKGAGQAITDVVGGHVQFLIGAISTSLPHVRAGKIHGIAVTGLQRSSAVPDLPTVAESGFPGFEVVQWFGLLAPAKTPPPIIRQFNTAVVEMYRDAQFAERFKRQGLEPATNTPEEFAKFIANELSMWTKVFKDVGISLK
jgi:tripartite-type tricarboxylate transporter receptor subunit TctC